MPEGKILLVDDEAALLKLMAAYLGRLGYEVATFTNTGEAWEEFDREPSAYNAVLLDMSMPGLPAEELAERILRANSNVRVIAASGYPTDVGALERSGGGRVAFLHKPFSPEMLADCIRHMPGG